MSQEDDSRRDERRHEAEKRVASLEAPPTGPLDSAQLAKSIHELLVHQVELESQNEELIDTRADLEAAAELLSELYDFAPIGYFSLSVTGLIRKLNFVGADMLGQERGRLLGGRFGDFVLPDHRRTFDRFLSRVFAGEASEPCEVMLLSKEGSSVIASLTGAASPDGLICRMAAMDITTQRQVEEEVREKNEDLDRIFNLSHDLLGIAGFDGRFHRINPAFERVLGYSREVLTGTDFMNFVHPDDREESMRARERLRKGEEVMDFVNRYICADGSCRWLEWRVTPYGDDLMCAVARDITERKEAEEALRESEGRLRLFIEHAPVGIAMFDHEMRYLAASDRWKRDYGLSGDVRGLNHHEIFPEIPARWKEVVRRSLAGEKLRMDEDPLERTDGTVQWFKWDTRPWFSSDGKIGGILIAAEDVTERVHGRDALRASEERLRLAIDAAKMGSWDWDLRTNDILWTPYQEVMLGFQQSTGRRSYSDFRKRLHPDDMERVEAVVRKAIENRTDYSCDFRVVWPDGSIHWISSLGRLILDAEGTPIRMLGMVMDITERKEAAEALRRSEEKFRSIVECSPTGIHLYHLRDDDQLVLIEANAGADKELGIDHGGLIGKPLEEIFPDLAVSGISKVFTAVAKGELGSQSFEIACDGDEISGYYEMSVFQTNPGTIVVAFSDVSERRSIRESLEKNREELESRVHRRTAQLHDRTLQLRALADELTHAEERERRRIAGLIHEDLQQMLVAALLNLGMLKSKIGDVSQSADFTHIENILRDSIKAARSLTSELSPPVLQQCGLAAALNWLRAWCVEKYGLDVNVDAEDCADPGPEVSVSLFRCVRELLFNIVKHAGVKSADLRMWRTFDDVLKIEVRDEGVGFDPQEIRAREGTVGGFGLFSIRERLELLGGGLEIESAPGAGSRFLLSVPMGTGLTGGGTDHSSTGSARGTAEGGAESTAPGSCI